MTPSDNPTPTQALVRQVRGDQFLEQVRAALPPSVSPERFQRILATTLLHSEDLAEEADHTTIVRAAIVAAGLGLLPDNREAAIVAFNAKGKRKKQATLLPMVGGYVKIAAEGGWAIDARAVFEGDEFTYDLGESKVHHVLADVDRSDSSKLTHVYALGRELHGPGRKLEVMTRSEVERIRATSKAKDSAFWKSWYDRMAAKTVAKLLFKSLPLGEREQVRAVLRADELAPGAAAELVYGSATQTLEAGQPPATPPAQAEEEAAPGATDAATPPAFKGEEPPPAEEVEATAVELTPELEAAEARELGEEFTRYATLGEVAAAEDWEYLGWLASDQITDEELRTQAQLVQEARHP